jgi:hypothetical protein
MGVAQQIGCCEGRREGADRIGTIALDQPLQRLKRSFRSRSRAVSCGFRAHFSIGSPSYLFLNSIVKMHPLSGEFSPATKLHGDVVLVGLRLSNHRLCFGARGLALV